jgi:plasmid stabilization system protein ParE
VLPIRITRRAAAQIREAARWWAANRPAAPTAFEEELRRGFALIAQQPGIGARATNSQLANVRRILLSRVRYYVYYRTRATRVEILALWHASRGQEPTL